MLNRKKKLDYRNLIEESGIFDEKYYLTKYKDARVSKFSAIEHFCREGLERGYRPNDSFNPIWYGNYYSRQVKDASLLPLIYFLKFGKEKNHFQNREEMTYYTLIKKSNLFDSEFYATTYNIPDKSVDLILDYIRHKEERKPNSTFNIENYYATYREDILKSNLSAFEHYALHYDELDKLFTKAKESISTPFKKNNLNIVALLPDKIESENRASMLRVVAPLSLNIIKEKIFFKALPYNFDFYEITTYDSCIIFANSITDLQKVEALIDVLKNHKIELIVYVEKEESKNLDLTIDYLLDNAKVALFSKKTLMERYKSKAKREFIVPTISEIELLNKDLLEYLALIWLQSIPKANIFVDNSELFDKKFYIDEYADLKRKKVNPLLHYFWRGWRENRFPSTKFDMFWYQEKYLQSYPKRINPILHYELIGKNREYEIKPKYKGVEKRVSLPTNPKRVALFAAYDKDGVIDESVVLFIKELSTYSDIYFLSDCIVLQKELDKLKPYTKGAWAYRHGEYDFGSYKRLAQYHVGWKELEKYDELLFVNDSSYLISSLNNVFNKMNNRKLSFWGIQATKGIKSTKDKASNKFNCRIPIKTIKEEYLKNYFNEDKFDFLLGSFFLAFRKNIIKDRSFQKFINNISKERNKVTIILRNEIGITKFLIEKGYDFETYMDDLYPFHPVYTNRIYDMIENGFPLFKRLFIVLNHYKEKKLYSWKEKLLLVHPKLDLKPIEENFTRVGDATAIYKNLDVEKNDKTLLLEKDFILEEKRVAVEENLWVFPVATDSHTLNEKTKLFLEKIKSDSSIKKVILYRSKYIEIEGTDIKTLPLYSIEGQEYLLKASKIFVGELLNLEVPFPLDIEKHEFINVNNL